MDSGFSLTRLSPWRNRSSCHSRCLSGWRRSTCILLAAKELKLDLQCGQSKIFVANREPRGVEKDALETLTASVRSRGNRKRTHLPSVERLCGVVGRCASAASRKANYCVKLSITSSQKGRVYHPAKVLRRMVLHTPSESW